MPDAIRNKVKQCFGAIVHESYHKRPVYSEMPRRMAGHLAGQNAFPGEVPSWITGQPEVILGAFGEFETCPDWGAKFQNPRRDSNSYLLGQRPLVYG
jgi:hypothetical protein